MPFPQWLTKKWGKEVGWKCNRCGVRWVDGFLLEAHHKIPTHNGGKDTRDNFELLCQCCHMKAHEELAKKDNTSALLIKARLTRTGGKWK